MPEPKTALALEIAQRNDAMKSARSPWDSWWQEVSGYVMPRKGNITSMQSSPSTAREQQLFDSTAIRANQTLANGQLSWMTPHEGRWFNFDAPAELADNDEVKQWFKRCTERAQTAIAQSDFYSQIHELYLDRGGFGTSVIYCERGKKSPVRFETWEIGSYSLAEDDEGLIDTCYRDLKLTVSQGARMFGAENLSEKLQKILKANDPKTKDEKHEFIHAIYPRDLGSIDPRKMDPENMPIASCYMEVAAKHICREAGYKELPFMATRFLKWGGAVYGYSPSWTALPDARQLNFLEKQMDALAEITAFPRILLPGGHEGDVDMRAAGVTYFDASSPNSIPKEWATAGRYDVGEARSAVKRKAIEDAFHVDLFQMFSRLDKQMTAREVGERSSEKLIQFSPTFARMTTELFNPLLTRVFSILLRDGHFPPPPQAAIISDENGAYLPEPKVSYNSRIALAIKSLENSAFAREMEMVMPLTQLRPDIIDNYDLDRIARDGARNNGLPADWMLPEEQVQKMREARAAAQAEQQKMEQAAQMAEAASKAGNIKPDSAVGQAMAGAM